MYKAVCFVIAIASLLAAAASSTAAEAVAPGNWALAASMPSVRYLHNATLLRNGDVLVAGGSSNDALLYHPDSDTWTSAGTLERHGSGATATRLLDGRVLLLGGANRFDNPFAYGDIYSPITNTWSRSADVLRPRVTQTATRLEDGRVLVVGGCITSCTGSNFEGGVDVYSPSTDTWSSAGPIQVPRSGHTATLLNDGRVLVVGGYSGRIVVPTAEVYDPATDTWTFVPELFPPREFHAATLLPDGQVLVAGGYISSSGCDSICAIGELQPERFDPTTNTWKFIADEVNAHIGGTMTLLDSGRVLVTGGSDLFGETALSETYNPVLDEWAVADPMSIARIYHTATLLKNGRVLVVGGFGHPYGFTASAEIYRPVRKPTGH